MLRQFALLAIVFCMSLLIILKIFCAFFHCYHHWHGMKCVQIRSYFWSIFLCIQSECRKIRTWSNSVFIHFSRNVAGKDKCTWPGPFAWNNLVFLSLDGCLRKKKKTKQKKHRLQKVGMNFILFYSTFFGGKLHWNYLSMVKVKNVFERFFEKFNFHILLAYLFPLQVQGEEDFTFSAVWVFLIKQHF